MDDRSEVTSAAGSEDPRQAVDHGRGGLPLAALRLALAGLVLAAGLALASPDRPAPAPRGAAMGTCQAQPAPQRVVVLPPGHPPVRGYDPQGRPVLALPPGHPPVDGPGAVPVPARPLGAVFAAPDVVDL